MEELMERIAGWVRKVIRPELDAALAQPVPLAGSGGGIAVSGGGQMLGI